MNCRAISLPFALLLLCLFSISVLFYLLESLEVPKVRHPVMGRQSPRTSQQLLNLPNFRYLLTSTSCQEVDDLIGVILVTSHAGDVIARNVHRLSLPFEELDKLKLRRVFLLATATKNQPGYRFIEQNQIVEESVKFGDIIQGNFQEAYHNLTYKHVMGLKWASENCAQAQFMIKMDDDIAVNVYRLLEVSKRLKEMRQGAMAGYLLDKSSPDRKNGKWRVSQQDWPESTYPPFLSGWTYVTTPTVAARIFKVLQNTKFFWIDDVLVTGVATRAADIKLVDIRRYFAVHSEQLRCCIQGDSCDFIVAPSGGDWELLRRYMTRVVAMKGRFKVKGRSKKCVVIGSANVLPLERGKAILEEVTLG